jgi:outer membrane protein assembly factor BamA
MRLPAVAFSALCALSLPVSAAKAQVPAWIERNLSPLWSWYDPSTAPFIPLPEIATDPNSGTTIGVLPIFLTTDENREITRILAPDIVHNQFLGYGVHARILEYPSQGTQWSAVAQIKEHAERGVDLQYATGLTRSDSWSYSVRLLYDRTATYRFFGLGNDTSHDAQSNYTGEQVYAESVLGWNAKSSLQIGWMFRPRFIEIEPGFLRTLPSTTQAFPGLPGLGTQHELFNRIFASYDTRDSIALPSKGSQVVVSAGFSDRAFGSSASYSAMSLDVRHYQPLDQRFTLAAHVALRYLPTGKGDAPFWAQGSLGGDRSINGEQQPLRAYGEGRFIDLNLFSAGAELRSRVADLDLFTTHVSVQIAPFVEFGKVFHDASDWPLKRLHTAGGIGFRAVAPPFIVGYVDIGYGSEGTAVFSGINYPF